MLCDVYLLPRTCWHSDQNKDGIAQACKVCCLLQSLLITYAAIKQHKNGVVRASFLIANHFFTFLLTLFFMHSA